MSFRSRNTNLTWWQIRLKPLSLKSPSRPHQEFFLNDTFSPGLLKEINATGNFVSAKNDSRSSVTLVCDRGQTNDPGIILLISIFYSKGKHPYCSAVFHSRL